MAQRSRTGNFRQLLPGGNRKCARIYEEFVKGNILDALDSDDRGRNFRLNQPEVRIKRVPISTGYCITD